ncbi:MAG: alcohol dehydrogenase catalytic domain-containing protein [Candidatus Omnitrophica bacterium]|nr:alcohol dehydrogenase catalytic domain-containing protein [Candidatus Omnitrophota bacterium]
MRAAVLYGKEDVRLEEVPLPAAGAGEVLVKIQAALTCGTDLKVFRAGSHARMIRPPALFGHEFAGVIEAVGPGVSGWHPGMRVVAANSAPCGDCFYCRKEQPNLCQDLLFVNGAYAEYLRLPARVVQKNLLEIPADLPFQAAAFTEPLACVLRGIQAARPGPGETAVILGSGPVGLMFAQLAAKAGARVILLGKGPRRLRIAGSCGADTVLNLADLKDPVSAAREATPEGRGADLVIEAVGRPAAWGQALEIVRPGGRVLLFGGCPAGTQVPLDAGRVHYDELTLLSVFHHTPAAIRQSLRLIAGGEIRTEPLITGQAPLKELPSILRQMLADQDSIKTAITP